MISKYLKKLNKMLIITGFIWIISLFFAHNTVLAYGTWQGDETSGMPQKGQYSPKGGLLPQILKEKTFSGDADTEFPYTPWSTDVSAGTVYCADSGSAIRYGKYDPALHYANEGVGAIFGIDYTNYSSYKLLMTKLCDEIGREIFDNMNKFLEGLMTKDWKYIATIPTSIGYKQIQGPTYYDDIYDIDTSKPIVVTKANAEYGDGETSYNYTRAEMSALKIATKIFKGLSNWDKTYTTDDKSTNMKAWEVSLWLGDKIDGPKAVIMETEDRAENGYKQKGNTKTANNFTNSKSANVAYILTAMENAYSGATNSIRERYNLADIQTAYWEAVDFDGISKAHETQNGLTLFERAKSYQTFVNKDLTNFQAKIDMSQTQIITNRNTNNYIVGPITINYPYYEDISYLKSIYLKINEDKGASSKTLIYDENNDDFEIEFIGQKVSGSNGLKKEYPASGSQFYIKFSASETAYPTKVGLYADVEHIKSSKIEYNELDTKANVYQYIGFVASSRDYNADHRKKRLRLAYGTAHATITYSYKVRVPKKIIYVFGIPVVVSWKWVTSYGWKNFTIDSNHYRDRTYDIAQPFVMMTREPVDEIKSQKLTVALEGKREYDVYHIEQHKDNITPPKNPGINTDTSVIDLTMKISGKVWVDGSVGKENQYDGKNGEGDTPMSNVKVSLYEVSKKPTTSTKPKPTLPTPTKTGNIFKGWYKDTTKIEETTTVDTSTNITLKASWEVIKYTLTVNPNGGTWNGNTTSQNFEQGYGTTKTIANPTATPSGYTVRFNTNGGTSTDSLQQIQTTAFDGWKLTGGGTFVAPTYTYGTSNGTLTAQYTGNNVTLPNATKTGSTLKGWYTSGTGGTRVGGAGDAYKPTESTTLFAQWNETEYTLTVNPNGGVWNGSASNQTVVGTYNSTKTIANPTAPNGYTVTLNDNGRTNSIVQTKTFSRWINSGSGNIRDNTTYTFGNGDGTLTAEYTANVVTLPTPTKDGYTFDGWFTSNGTKISENDNVNITENITLIAKWQGESYTLTVNPNGGTWNESSEIQTVVGTYNSTREISNPIAPKGYTVTLNDSENTTSVVQTKSFNGWAKTGRGTIAGTTYTFGNGNGEIVANYTSNKVTLPIPTKEGYTFKGWFTQENGGTKIETSYMPESDITLYTQWEANKYTITFDGNGVTLEQNSKEVTYGQTYGELPEPTKEGYDFDGWYTEDGNLIKSTDIVNITKNITLTANWSVKKYTVTFKNDDGSVLYTTLAQYGNKIVYSGKTPVSTKIIPGYESKFKGWENEEALENIQCDTTVTAIYEVTIIQYKITYNNIRDCDNSKNPTGYTIKDSNITLENLEDKEDSKFLGWYDKAVEGNKVESIDTSKLENIILYAQWKDDKLYLKSEKYKVGENDIDNYEDGDIYLDKIQPETTLKQLMENCDTNGIISVIDKNGKEITEDEIVGTGMKIKVTRYGQQIQLTAVVMGDLDGDGKVSAVDLSTLNQVLLKIIQINGSEFKAADLDDNKKITATDLSTINNTILKNIELTYDKSFDRKTNE